LSLARSHGAISGMECMVPQSLAASGNRPYLDLLAVTSDTLYPGYKTPIVAPKPSVKRVVRVVHSMRDRIGTHMILWVPSQDSEV
jgi:hypothetical protein